MFRLFAWPAQGFRHHHAFAFPFRFAVAPVYASKYGKAKSFRIGGQLYVQFPVRPKAEQPAQGERA